MQQETWTAIDGLFANLFAHKDGAEDDALTAALQANTKAELPAIDVSPNQGQLLNFLAKLIKAQNILEIGTLGGYSTIWLARALPEKGKVVTLEYEERHAEVAQQNIARAGLADKVDIRVGDALTTLPQLEAEGAGPFDLIFIDADKPNNPAYLEWSCKLARKGTLIIGDNVVRKGEVLNENSDDPSVQGVRTFLQDLSANPNLETVALQTVGAKGYDGLTISRVL